MIVFALAWAVIFLRIKPDDVQRPAPIAEMEADEESEASVLAR